MSRIKFLIIVLCLLCFGNVACADKEIPKEQTNQKEAKVENSDEDKREAITESAQENEKNVADEAVQKHEKEDASQIGVLSPLHVEGATLTDENGMPVLLRGVSTHGLAWYPQYVNQNFFIQLRNEWNADIVRLAMYTAEDGGYCNGGNQSELKQLIKDGVAYAKEAGLYVIVDWHVLRDCNPNTYKEEAKVFFDEMSKEFCDETHVIYEICNEPNGGVSWQEVKAYAEEVIPVIRANDEDAIIIVGTPNWSQDVDVAASDPITGYDNIMYALHFYAATHKDDLRTKAQQAIDMGLPVFATEFGICDASGNGAIDTGQANVWTSFLDKNHISYIAWNLSDKNESSAIFVQGCQKTEGFVTEDLTTNGKWVLEMLGGKNKLQGTDEQSVSESQKPEDSKPEEKIPLQNAKVQNEEEQHIEAKDTSEQFEYKVSVTNSWETDGKIYEQYVMSIKNVSEQKTESWKAEVSFEQPIGLSDGWNGNYTVKDDKLEITNMDYNAAMEAGGEITDIGFIIFYDAKSE